MIAQNPLNFAVFCLIFISLTNNVLSDVDTSVLVPSTLEDGNENSADANSTIGFGPLTTFDNSSDIECSGCIGDDGVRPFLDFAKSFSQALISGDYQYKWVQRGKDGEVGDDYQEAVNDHMGLIICIGIGLVFFLVFPIVGICVCCCRCCGKCGGDRMTNGIVKEGCQRPCLMISLALLSAFVAVGGALVLATNDSVSDGITSVHDDMPNNLDAMLDYMKNAVKTLEDITTNDFDFTKQVIFRDLDNIGYLMGNDVKENLKKKIKLDDVSKTVETIETALTNLLVLVPRINEHIKNVGDNVDAYVTAMTSVEEDFYKNVSAYGGGTPGLNKTLDKDEIPELGNVTDLESVKNASITKLLNDGLEEIDDIPNKVQNNSNTTVADLKSSINDYTSDVKNLTEDLDIDKEIDRQSLKDDFNEFSDEAVKYNKYRSYAGLGLGCIILFIAALFFMGLVFGCVGGGGSVPPHERGCGSSCGGNLLLAACGITFIFGSLIMLITVILLAIGAPTEDYVCVALEDPSIMDKLIDDYDLLGESDGNGNYLGKKILDDPDKTLTLSEILTNCENNQAIYKAFRMNESNLINLTDILDYKSKFSVEERVSSINVDFKDIQLFSADLDSNLQKLNDSIQYNITQYENELNQNPSKSATDFQNELRAGLSTAGPNKDAFTYTINDIQGVLDKEGKELNKSVDALSERITELDELLYPAGKLSLSQQISSFETQLKDLDDNMENYGNKSLNSGVDAFSKRLFRVTDSFIDYLLNALDNDLGKCQPIWDFYKTLFQENLCGTLIDSVNGFWFALGWSLFFLMPSLVIAFKLSSYFRRMRLMDGAYDSSDQEMKYLPDSGGPPPYVRPNKVAPNENYYFGERREW